MLLPLQVRKLEGTKAPGLYDAIGTRIAYETDDVSKYDLEHIAACVNAAAQQEKAK